MGHRCLPPELVAPGADAPLNSGIRSTSRQQESNFSGMLSWPSRGWDMARTCRVHPDRGAGGCPRRAEEIS
jgi:hypothetical protein